MRVDLNRPDHVDDETWAAIETHNARFAMALSSNDRPWVIGAGKELVECVARVVLDAKSVTVGSNADFDKVVNEAHIALERQPGPDVSMSPDVKAIAGSAKKMVLHVRSLRNDYGTGHGRSKQQYIDDEMVSVVADATMLWVRWALRRLEHILIGEADMLIEELRGSVSRRSLQKHLDAVTLPEQPPEVQHAIGVAFGQRSAGDTFVARQVGVDWPAAVEDIIKWPVSYRLGLVEGFILDRMGYASLSQKWVPTVVNVLAPVPATEASDGLREIAAKVHESANPYLLRGASAELDDLGSLMRNEGQRLKPPVRAAWNELAEEFDPARAQTPTGAD
jgi:hypothetical protein